MTSNLVRIAIIGSGNWASCIAKIIGNNVLVNPKFEKEIRMYVYEEMVNGRKLSEIINTEHENIKYLPGHILPSNVLAEPDLLKAAEGADMLMFIIPHQFLRRICSQLVGQVKQSAFAVSLCKGFDEDETGKIGLISDMIHGILNIECCVVMGANIATEIAEGKFSEATIGARNLEHGSLLKQVIQTPNFRISVCQDREVVEACGALKNIVAVGAGFVEGLGMGDNTRAAVIRLGLMEMCKFCRLFYPKHDMKVYFESSGVADLVATCHGGRNRKVSAEYARTGKPFDQLEKEMLNGQMLQGPMTAKEVYNLLKSKGIENDFPLFTAVHKICSENGPAASFIDAIREHPERM